MTIEMVMWLATKSTRTNGKKSQNGRTDGTPIEGANEGGRARGWLRLDLSDDGDFEWGGHSLRGVRGRTAKADVNVGTYGLRERMQQSGQLRLKPTEDRRP